MVPRSMEGVHTEASQRWLPSTLDGVNDWTHVASSAGLDCMSSSDGRSRRPYSRFEALRMTRAVFRDCRRSGFS